MTKKKTWPMTDIRVGMFWPRATIVTVHACLSENGDRELEARLSLDEARELRDALSDWLQAAEAGWRISQQENGWAVYHNDEYIAGGYESADDARTGITNYAGN